MELGVIEGILLVMVLVYIESFKTLKILKKYLLLSLITEKDF